MKASGSTETLLTIQIHRGLSSNYCPGRMVICSVYVTFKCIYEVQSAEARGMQLLLLLLLYDMDVSCHRPFLPGTSLKPAVNPTAQASSFTLLHTAVLSVLCVMFQV
jgi:hypothetical protein